ncbi:phage antirepressor KilAC domain-containing protein [Bacillus toyonensis]|uniref:phage antirepressor KilAC domain-containing protein n=1 Tax=Bacillus toyonensis TaxID=155322 RepID=UPI000BED0DD6|nr:phage antirepressor KilAC domain-containing protein [Bacillus toyonensis]MDA2459766.1 phage antirepressor KilAC domain-containing protein [Bacillus cereus]MRC15532.1 hypothetical protein [Bacillus thuringiensis]PED95172.1 hypothetical protein CON90_08770 [Bacillus toyonensis]HDR7900369.1 phage antirepressor KilAC domain-containing protein [Bacillus cereus]HDX9612070.1 phage antirepressor KilAC domain-containing protein [Bacillus toyonensis]
MKNTKIKIELNEAVFNPQQVEKAAEIIDARTKRDELAERIDILEKVKAVVTLPNIGMVTTRQIADFYETDIKTIQKIYGRNRAEIQSDGYTLTTGKKLLVDKLSTRAYTVEHGFYRLELDDGSTVKIPNSTIGLFSIRAVLRFGMLLQDSKIAVEVRNQLLNIRDNADNHTRTKAIDAELIELREKAAKYDALIGDMPAEIVQSYENIIKYANDQRAAAEQKAQQLANKVTRYIEDDSLITLSDLGTSYLNGMTAQAIRSELQVLGVLSMRKTSGTYRPVGEYREKGWFKIEDRVSESNGFVYRQLYVTHAGIIGISKLF